MREVIESAADKVVEHADPVAFVQRTIHHVAADEARAAGDSAVSSLLMPPFPSS